MMDDTAIGATTASGELISVNQAGDVPALARANSTHPASSLPPDDQVVGMWLHGRPVETQRAYRREADRFREFVGKPLAAATLGNVQAYADTLVDLAPSSQGRALGAVKSLLAFTHRLGYLPFDVGRAVRVPARRDGLAQRILSETEVHRLLALEPNLRNRVLLRFLYASGVRVSEAVGVC